MDQETLAQNLNELLKNKSPQEVILYCLDKFSQKIAFKLTNVLFL
jgi:hypothetical protein